jgi:ATP-dependent helicase/nuclease subunit B
MDELVNAIFERRDARVGRVRPLAEPIDAVAVLYDIQVAADQPLGGPVFMSLDSFFPLGMRIQADLEELLVEGVTSQEVAGVQPLVEEEVPQQARERLRTLAHFYEQFYPAVDRCSLSTRSSRYASVSRSLEPSDLDLRGPLILAGFHTLTKAEQEIFRIVQTWPQAQLLFQDGPGLREKLAPVVPSAGWDSAAPAALPRPRLQFTSSPDTHGQVFALNELLEKPDDDTLIVLPSAETLFPLLRHCLSRFDPERYNVSLPYPLHRTPLFGLFSALMDAVSTMDGPRVYVPDYLAFVLHPYVKNLRLGGSAEATRVLFHALEERMEATRTRRFLTLEEIEGDPQVLSLAAERLAEGQAGPTVDELRVHLAEIHGRTIRRFGSFSDIRDFAGRCIELIAWIEERSTARDHPFFSPFAQSFVEALEAVRQSLAGEKPFADRQGYFGLLRSYLKSRDVPLPGTPLHGMQVLGGLETRSLQFGTVFVLDANQGVLPPAARESTLLPFPVRQALGLPTSRDYDDLAAYHFDLLAAGARTLHLFYVDRGDRDRSRFVERLLWEEQRRRRTAEDRQLVRPISYRVTLTNPLPLPIPKGGEVAAWLAEAEHSPTSLDAYLQCPLKYYYRTVLRLAPREEVGHEVDSREIGILVHSALSRYFAGRSGGRYLGQEDIDAPGMDRAVDEAFDAQFGPAEAGPARLLHGQVRGHLREFLTDYLRPLLAGHRVRILATEQEYAVVWNGVRLRGRMDLVLERDGAALLVDYKTSANSPAYRMRLDRLVLEERDSWRRAIPTLQLPLYVLMHAAASGLPPAGIQAQVLLLGRNRLGREIEQPLFDDPGAAHESWAILEAVIRRLLEEILSPDVPFSPTPDLRDVCPRCEFTAICGTGWLARGSAP